MGLTVRCKVRRSRTHGRGLVADQDLARGEVVWRFDPRVDRVVRDLPTAPERYWRFRHFAYYDKHLREWVYSTDKSKWMNHAARPNTAIRSDGSLVTRRRIRRGGEITINYCHESGLCRGDAEWPTVDRATTPPLRPPPRSAFRRAPPPRARTSRGGGSTFALGRRMRSRREPRAPPTRVRTTNSRAPTRVHQLACTNSRAPTRETFVRIG